MRNAVVQLPSLRSANDERQVIRAAIRQLERAELYFHAVEAMDLSDHVSRRAIERLRRETETLRRHLGERRTSLSE